MKNIETSRRIAYLLANTNYKISIADVCAYINAEKDFFEQKEICVYDEKYLAKAAGLSKKKVKKLMEAEKEILDMHMELVEEYPLAKDYARINTCLAMMDDWEGFAQMNPDLYKEAEDYNDKIGETIITECENKYAEDFKDLISDGKISEENFNPAVRRYMQMNGFVPSGWDEE